ncbi:hypothetical protein BC941DRAFT_419626 [Chlamydoabsidia padenii]|nr:hypothetical protein BC941DRAFT_419626 [Chlamydoabsidia padenii]
MAELKQHHEQDLLQLKQRLGHAEKRAKSDMNDEVEKLLREFEQSEHDHTQQLAHLQQSHREQLTVMKQDQQAEIRHHIQKRNSVIMPDSSTTLVAPLRKTGGPAGKVLRWPAMGALNDQPDLTPKDPHALHVYVSSVSSNPTIKRNQETIQTLLTSHHIQYQVIDVARREPALQHMRRQTNGRSLQLPLIFIGGSYRGQLDDLIQAQESDRLTDFLSLSAEQRRPSTASTSSSTASTPVTTPTASRAQSSIAKSDYNEDEFLLKELEKELASNHGLNLDF